MAGKPLAKFEIKKAGDGYILHLEDEGGAQIELTADAEQLDVISEQLIELLETDDTAEVTEQDEEA